MAGCKKKSSKLQDAHYKQYAISGKCGVNRLRALEQRVKKHPNDLQAAEQLKKGNTGYTRKTPKASLLTGAIKKRLAIIKYFAGKGYKDLISKDFITHSVAWKKLNATKYGIVTAKPKHYTMMNIASNLPDNTVKLLQAMRLNCRKFSH